MPLHIHVLVMLLILRLGCVDDLLNLCEHEQWGKAFQEVYVSQSWTAVKYLPYSRAEQLQHVNSQSESILFVPRLRRLLTCGTHFDKMVTRLMVLLPGLSVHDCNYLMHLIV